MEDLGRRKALSPEGADGEGVVALGEASAVLVRKELGVEVSGSGEVEGALKEELADGGLQEVAASDYCGNLHVCAVDDAGVLVAGEAGVRRVVAKGFAPDEEVAKVFACGKGLRTQAKVCEVIGAASGTRNRSFVLDLRMVGVAWWDGSGHCRQVRR